MATQLARAHTHLSNRAKVRSTLERKSVFRSVLENPFYITWPSVPANVQNTLLARLVAALENIPQRTRASRKTLLKSESSSHQGNVTIAEKDADIHCNSAPALDRACPETSPSASPHPIIGINEVTRALELQLRLIRQRVVLGTSPPNDGQAPPCSLSSPIVVVFVCCADVDPTTLVDHIPYLVAGCNSPGNVTELIKLVPLPKGSEPTISQILGVRRAAAVAFRRGSPSFETLQDITDSVPIISAPWLHPSDIRDNSQLVPAHIKQLRTTAPKHMKAAREERAKARTVAKRNLLGSSRPVRRKPRLKLATGSASTT